MYFGFFFPFPSGPWRFSCFDAIVFIFAEASEYLAQFLTIIDVNRVLWRLFGGRGGGGGGAFFG